MFRALLLAFMSSMASAHGNWRSHERRWHHPRTSGVDTTAPDFTLVVMGLLLLPFVTGQNYVARPFGDETIYLQFDAEEMPVDFDAPVPDINILCQPNVSALLDIPNCTDYSTLEPEDHWVCYNPSTGVEEIDDEIDTLDLFFPNHENCTTLAVAATSGATGTAPFFDMQQQNNAYVCRKDVDMAKEFVFTDSGDRVGAECTAYTEDPNGTWPCTNTHGFLSTVTSIVADYTLNAEACLIPIVIRDTREDLVEACKTVSGLCTGTAAFCSSPGVVCAISPISSTAFCSVGYSVPMFVHGRDTEAERRTERACELRSFYREPKDPVDRAVFTNCTTNYDGRALSTSCDADFSASHVAFGWTDVVASEDKATRVLVPQTTKNRGGVIEVNIASLDNSKLLRRTIILKERGNCEPASCVVCSEFFTQWRCVSAGMRFLIVLASAVPIVLGIILIRIAMELLLWVYWIISPCTSMCKYAARGKKDNKKVTMDGLKQAARAGALAALAISAPRAWSREVIPSSCVGGISHVSDVPTCIRNVTTETCTHTLGLTASIGMQGGSACYSLKNEQGEAMEELEIHYESAIAAAPLDHLYYTGYWSMVHENRNRCPLAPGAHCSAEQCSNVNYPTNEHAYNNLKNAKLQAIPGVTGCKRGAYSCGVPLIKTFPSCLYHRYGFDVTSKGAIMLPRKLQTDVTLQIRLGGVTIARFTAGTNNTVTAGGFSVGLTAVSYHSPVHLGEEKVYVSRDNGHTNVSLVVAAPKDTPILGMFGDIQSDSLIGLGDRAKSAFADGMITVGGTGDHINFLENNRRRVAAYLPGTHGTRYWNSDGSKIWTVVEESVGIILHIETTKKIVVSRKIDRVCPVIDFIKINSEGCHSCDAGFSVTITAYSECLGGPVAVTSSTDDVIIGTGILKLRQGDEETDADEFRIICKAKTANVDFDMIFTAGDEQTTLAISGRLKEPNDIDPSRPTPTPGDRDKVSSSDWWSGLLKSLGFGSPALGWFMGIVYFLLAVAIFTKVVSFCCARFAKAAEDSLG